MTTMLLVVFIVELQEHVLFINMTQKFQIPQKTTKLDTIFHPKNF